MDAVVEERWREERRGRILAAAARVFASRSYADASMDEIAAEAGIGKPTLYRYVGSKDALFTAVFSDALDRLETRLRVILDEVPDVAERLVRLVGEIAPVCRDHLVPLRYLGPTAAAADQSKRRVFRERRAALHRYIAAAVDEGVRAGTVRDEVDGTRIAQMTIGMIWSSAGAGLSDHEIARAVADVLLRGIVAPASPSSGRRTDAGASPASTSRESVSCAAP